MTKRDPMTCPLHAGDTGQSLPPSMSTCEGGDPLPFMGEVEVEDGDFECEATRFVYRPREISFEFRCEEGDNGPCTASGRAILVGTSWRTTEFRLRYKCDSADSPGTVAFEAVELCASGTCVTFRAQWLEGGDSWSMDGTLEPFNATTQNEKKAALSLRRVFVPTPLVSKLEKQSALIKPAVPRPQVASNGSKEESLPTWPPRPKVAFYTSRGTLLMSLNERDVYLPFYLAPKTGRKSRTAVVGLRSLSVQWTTWTNPRLEQVEASMMEFITASGWKGALERMTPPWRRCSSEFRWKVTVKGEFREPFI